MDADDSKCWGLFENRPARERTSPALPELSERQQRSVGSGDGWSRLRRKPGTDTPAERVKC